VKISPQQSNCCADDSHLEADPLDVAANGLAVFSHGELMACDLLILKGSTAVHLSAELESCGAEDSTGCC
jgi:hypothetical protein